MNVKSSRFQYEYRKSASKLHKRVGDLLRESTLFSGYESYQEYPVNKVNTSYPDGSHHFDWVIPMLKIVFECHGKQHYESVAFDGDVEKSIDAFKALKLRDEAKKLAALEAGYSYVEIPYTALKDLDEDWLVNAISNAETQQTSPLKKKEKETQKKQKTAKQLEFEHQQSERNKELRRQYLQSEQHKEQLRKARSLQQEQYKKFKERNKHNA